MYGWLKRLVPCFHEWEPYGSPWEMWSPVIGDVQRQRFDCRKCGAYHVRDTGSFMGETFTHRHPVQKP